jgi:hypothetical protein
MIPARRHGGGDAIACGVVLIWLLAAAVFAAQINLSGPEGATTSWSLLLIRTSSAHWIWLGAWALLSAMIVLAVHRWPPAQAGLPRFLAAHLIGSLIVAVSQAALAILLVSPSLHQLVVNAAGDTPLLASFIIDRARGNFLVYWLVVSFGLIAGMVTRHRDRELRSAEIEARLRQAEAAALRSQLQPHFLFNTLNSIAACIREDPDVAERLVVRLADLLRMVTRRRGDQFVRLTTELELLYAYVGIEQERFSDRLLVLFDVSDEAMSALVPDLLIQPLVENAIRHGLAPTSRPVTVHICINRFADRLIISVYDDGAGADAGDMRLGIGLGNTEARLLQLYHTDDAPKLKIETQPDTGFSVTINLPWRLQHEPDINDHRR